MYDGSMLEFAKSHWRCLRDVGPDGVTDHGSKVCKFSSRGGDYFLKAKQTAQDVERENLIVKKCRQENFPVAMPIEADNGDPFVEHGGQRYILSPALAGHHLSDIDGEGGRVLGRAIAAFQNAIAGLPGNVFPGYDGYFHDQSGRLEKLRQAGKNIDDFIQPFEGEGNSRAFTVGLIHRDPHPRNMLFTEGQLSGFLDFDLVKVGPRLFDPCYCATGLLVEGWQDDVKRQKWFAALGAIVDGYFQAAQPPFDERNNVWLMLLEIQMIFIIWLNETGQSSAAKLNEEVFMWLVDNRTAIEQAVAGAHTSAR